MWVHKGTPHSLLKHVTSRGFEDIEKVWVRRLMQGLLAYNNYTKRLALGFSLFHHFALLESFIAAYGLNWKNPLINPFEMKRVYKQARLDFAKMQSNPAHIGVWHRVGFEAGSPIIDIDNTSFDEMIEKVAKYSEKGPGGNKIAKGARAMLKAKQKADHWLWHELQPTMKFHIAEKMLADVQANPDYAGVPIEMLREDIAKKVNDAFGGQEWERYLWANPLVRDWMQLLLFAPDWTISAINVAGLPDIAQSITGQKNFLSVDNNTDLGVDFMANQSLLRQPCRQ